MKKKFVVSTIVVVVLIIILITSYFICREIIKEGRKYEIENIEDFNYMLFKQEDKYGVIDKNNKILVNADYSSIIIPNPEKPVFIVEQEGDVKVLNDKNEQILTEYSEIAPIRLKNVASSLMYEKSVLVYTKDGKKGLIDLEGNKIIEPVYETIDSISYKEGELIVKREGKFGMINIKGNDLVKAKYDQISVDGFYIDGEGYKYAGYIVSEKTNEGYRYGYVDVNGKLLMKMEYNDLERITDIEDKEQIYVLVAKNGKYGVFKNNEEIISNDYQSIRYDKPNNVFIVERNKKYGVFDINGKEIIPIKYSQIDITGMYLYAKQDENTEVFDNKGQLTNMSNNIFILETQNENYKIKIDNTEGTVYSIVDKDGNELTKQQYSYIDCLYDNYFIVSDKNGKLGLIDSSENIKLEIKYDSIEKIENMDIIKTTILSGVTQLFSKDFEVLCEMSDATIKDNGDYIKIYNTTDTRYFGKDGKERTYKEIDPNLEMYAKKLDNGKWIFEDASGNIKSEEYDKVTELNEYGFAGVKKDGIWGVIDKTGKVIKEPIYEFSKQIEPDFIGEFYKVEYGFGEFYYTNEI